MTETTQLKFVKSERTGELVGFVSKTKDNVLKGVREDSIYRKRICLLSEELKGSVLPNILYDVELKPMHHGKNGYVVTAATRVVFSATVESYIVPGKNTRYSYISVVKLSTLIRCMAKHLPVAPKKEFWQPLTKETT